MWMFKKCYTAETYISQIYNITQANSAHVGLKFTGLEERSVLTVYRR